MAHKQLITNTDACERAQIITGSNEDQSSGVRDKGVSKKGRQNAAEAVGHHTVADQPHSRWACHIGLVSQTQSPLIEKRRLYDNGFNS